MSERIEQYMRTLKLGGLAKEWRSVEYKDTEQYVTDLLLLELKEREANRINRMVKTAGFRVIKTLEDFIWKKEIELRTALTASIWKICFWSQRETSYFWEPLGPANPSGNSNRAESLPAGRHVRFLPQPRSRISCLRKSGVL